MPFVIGAGTFVTGFGTGIQSVNLTFNPQIQRLYQLGSSIPFDKNIIKQKTLVINRYSGQGTSYDVQPSTTCTEPDPFQIDITANNCTNGNTSNTDFYFISSYSYSKELQGWGIESYNLITRPLILTGSNGQFVVGDTQVRMIRGIAEGQASTDGFADPGIIFNSTTVPGETIEVTAGVPGIGRAHTLLFGEVTHVGGGTGKSDGKDGTGQVTVPYSPIYLPI